MKTGQSLRLSLGGIRTGLAVLAMACASVRADGQQGTVPSRASAERGQLSGIEERLDRLGATLVQTQAALQQSLLEIQRLHAEMDELRSRTDSASSKGVGTVAEDVRDLREQQEIQQAEIKQHDQAKVETASKYGLKVTGLVLFNAFSNAGVVDSTELPTVALPRPPGASHGSLGATVRQTVLGVQAAGPVILGARSSAYVNADFFGGSSTNSFGYTALSGYLRLRDAEVGLEWMHTKFEAGNMEPLISPLSPTSFAEVAAPALSGSGNLWGWWPQMRLEERIRLGRHGISGEGGMIVPQSPAYSSIQQDSPVQASRRPGVEGRVSFHADPSALARPESFAFGVSGYSARQAYSASTRVHSWAVAGDYVIPITRFAGLSGELYRGRALGGFGGGLYKDILSGTDPVTGVARSVGVETAGGWSQMKMRFGRSIEANAIFGLDNALSSNFESVVLPALTTALASTARNRSVVGNVIFRPRAAVILSPEYRRMTTWRYTGGASVANIYTLSLGYEF